MRPSCGCTEILGFPSSPRLTRQTNPPNLANMITVNMHEAKTQLSRLVRSVEKGEHILICRKGKPVAEIRAPTVPAIDRLASHPDLKPVWVAPDFDPVAPASEDEWPTEAR